jgi:putative membrane protein
VLAAAAVTVYVRATRADPPRTARVVSFALGLVIVIVTLNSPLETLAAKYLLLAHSLQNALIADLAPPLLILGLTTAMQTAVARAGGRTLARLSDPRVALPVWLVTWYGLHLPALYDLALRHAWLLNVQHALLIAAGLIFWWPVLAAPHRLSTPAILAYLGVAFATSAFLGLAFIFSSHPFYDFYVHAPRVWGLSPIKDQNLGGIFMNAEQTLVFLAALAWFLLRLLDEEETAARAAEGAKTG